MIWQWPLPGVSRPSPLAVGDAAFGAVRKHDVHTGVDLFCVERQPVVSVACGQVLAVVPFTGPDAGSPWWLPSKAILVEIYGTEQGEGCLVLYGEVEPEVEVKPYLYVDSHRQLGRVVRACPKDDGRPTTMLHLELWSDPTAVLSRYADGGHLIPNDWPLGAERPEGLLDPTARLEAALTGREVR